MFAPTASRPPYYPSYSPPEPTELTALLSSKAFIPVHGMGATNEAWKIEHGVYLSEAKENEMASAEVHRTTQSMLEMQKMLKAKATAAAVTQGHKAALAAVSDPASLIYTDPHSYAYWIERQNLNLFSLFSLPSDIWAQLKNTPFLRYAYHGVFAIDVGRLDTECQHRGHT